MDHPTDTYYVEMSSRCCYDFSPYKRLILQLTVLVTGSVIEIQESNLVD